MNIGGHLFRVWTNRDLDRVRKFMQGKRSKGYGALRRVLKDWPQVQVESRPQPEQPLMAMESRTFQAVGPKMPEARFDASVFVDQFGATDEVLTLKELAEWLKVKPSTIYELSRSPRPGMEREPLPSHKVGKELRFSKQEICEWLNKRAEERKEQIK